MADTAITQAGTTTLEPVNAISLLRKTSNQNSLWVMLIED
jgi:hypothetical protein